MGGRTRGRTRRRIRGEAEEDGGEGRRDRDADAQFHEKDSQMAPASRARAKGSVIQKRSPQQDSRDACSRKKKDADCHRDLELGEGKDFAKRQNAKDKPIKNESRRENSTRLKAAPWAQIAVKLNIEGKEENGGAKERGDHAKDKIMMHHSLRAFRACVLFSGFR